MSKKCLGCGSVLQHIDIDGDGYIDKKNYSKSEICERCFRIRNYGEYKQVAKTNKEFINILKDINKTDDLVVLVLDVLNLPKNLDLIQLYDLYKGNNIISLVKIKGHKGIIGNELADKLATNTIKPEDIIGKEI
jgi:hypothetical protein